MIGTDWLRRKAAARKPASGGIATVYRNPDDPAMPWRLDLGGGLLIAYAASGQARVINDTEEDLRRALAEAATRDAAELAEDRRNANCPCAVIYSKCVKPTEAPGAACGLGLRTSKRYDSHMSSTAPEPAASPASQLMLPCTGCVIDVKQGLALGRNRAELPDPLPGTVMVNGMLLCDVRHQLNVGTPPPPSLLIAPADALPGRMLA